MAIVLPSLSEIIHPIKGGVLKLKEDDANSIYLVSSLKKSVNSIVISIADSAFIFAISSEI